MNDEPHDQYLARRSYEEMRSDFSILQDEIEILARQVGQLPTRRDAWWIAFTGAILGAIAVLIPVALIAWLR